MTDWFDASGIPGFQSSRDSATVRAEFAAIEAGISDKLPPLTGKASEVAKVNAGGTALESGPLAVAAGGTGVATAVAARSAMLGRTYSRKTADQGSITTTTLTDDTHLTGIALPEGNVQIDLLFCLEGNAANLGYVVGLIFSNNITGTGIGHLVGSSNPPTNEAWATQNQNSGTTVIALTFDNANVSVGNETMLRAKFVVFDVPASTTVKVQHKLQNNPGGTPEITVYKQSMLCITELEL